MVNQLWAFISEAGFFGWVACTIGFIFGAFGPEDTFNGRKAVFWGSLTLLLYTLWIMGMMKA